MVEQQENTTNKPLAKAAVAIKMSDDDVAQYLYVMCFSSDFEIYKFRCIRITT